jgi:hypothetical protein
VEVEKTIDTLHGKFLLRPYCDEDEQNVLDLWEIAFGKKIPIEIWRWKFHNNPFGRQIMLCLTESGLPVAVYAGIPYPANWNGQEIRMTQLIDNMSHPEYRFQITRSKGLYALTVEYFAETYGWPGESAISYGFPGDRHFRLGKLLFGYQMTGGGGVYLNANLQSIKLKRDFTFRKTDIIDRPGSFFNELQTSLTREYPFAALRNSKFIQWRFFENPVNKYLIYAGKSWNNVPLSYVVLLIQKDTATLVDIFGPHEKREISRLIANLFSDMKSWNVQTIQTWLPANHFLATELQLLGFEKIKEPIGFIPTVRIYHPKLTIGYINGNIYYTMADGDLF